jgi:hypothetical protein
MAEKESPDDPSSWHFLQWHVTPLFFVLNFSKINRYLFFEKHLQYRYCFSDHYASKSLKVER